MDYIKFFNTEAEYNAAKKDFDSESVSWLNDIEEARYDAEPDYSKMYFTTKALEDGTFTLTIPSSVDSNYMTSISYSTDEGETWTTTTVDNTAQTITTPTINAGDVVLWKGEGIALSESKYSGTFSSTGNFNVIGNVMSLFYGDNFENRTSFAENSYHTLKNAFNGATHLFDAGKLILPANKMTRECYCGMFKGCTSLTTAPELPATTLENFCYQQMFQGCTSLTTAPALPATTLYVYCYQQMFQGCTSLTTAPELPATTLMEWCYAKMFYGCTSLTTAPVLSSQILVCGCYDNMFNGCSKLNYIKALFITNPIEYADDNVHLYAPYTTNWLNGVASNGTFVKGMGVTWSKTGVDGIPTGWTAIETDWTETYDYLTTEAINDCVFTLTVGSSVNLDKLKSVEYSTDDGETWTKTNNVASTTVTVTTPTITAGNSVKWRCNGSGTSMTDYTHGSNSTVYVSTFSSTDQYRISGKLQSLAGANTEGCGTFGALFKNSTNLMSVEDLELSNSLVSRAYTDMFKGCTSITTSPILRAPGLVNKAEAYYGLFQGCSNLNHITTLQTGYSSTDYPNLQDWVDGVAATGIFVKSGNATYWTATGTNSIPTGWTVTEWWPKTYDYFTTEAIEDTTITFSISANKSVTSIKYVEYSTDGGENWTRTDNVNNTAVTVTTPTIAAGDNVKWRCAAQSFSGTTNSTSSTTGAKFTSTGRFNVCGNIQSLLGCTNYYGSVNPSDSMPINGLFNGATKLVSAKNLKMPRYAALEYTFYGCTSLTHAPRIQMNFVGEYGCYRTFSGCTSLTTVPELTIGFGYKQQYISKSGCVYMFYNCTSLVDITNTSINTGTRYLGKEGFSYMFQNCASLTTVPYDMLSNMILNWSSSSNTDYTSQSAFNSMFQGCTALVTAPELPTTTSRYSHQYMFKDCTALTVAPELPAATLCDECYAYMFQGCTSLTTPPTLQATNLASLCCSYMFDGCTSLTTLPSNMLPATTLVSSCYTYMFRGCTSLTTVPSNLLPATNLVTGCYSYMFNGCTNLSMSPTLPSTSLATRCYSHMFDGTDALPDYTNIDFSTQTSGGLYGLFAGTKVTYNDLLTILPLNGENKPCLPATTLSGEECYREMFMNCTSLVTPPVLPATTLTTRCYSNMFEGCTALTTVPELPATTLATWCYTSMFRGCTSLTTVPSNLLPSLSAPYACYNLMFGGCTSLTTTPSLPATSLGSICYFKMFQGCTSLTTPPSLPATTLGQGSYCYMFDGCTSLTSVPALPATSLPTHNSQYYSAYGYMFQGCTSLTTVPSDLLPATTGTGYCYAYMFNGCTSLTNAPNLPATTLGVYSYQYMFQGCKALTTAPSLPATTVGTYCYRAMFYGCTGLTTAPSLSATTLGNFCCLQMFQGCTSLTTVPLILPATTLTQSCYNQMFRGCNKITTAPELPATTLVGGCYSNMFNGCSQLNYIKAMFTTTPSTSYTSNWVSGVKSTGTFVKNSAATWTTSGVHGVPTNWTVETASA